MFKFIINWLNFNKNITPEEQKRQQKCKEIQNHINYLKKQYNFNLFYPTSTMGDEDITQKCIYYYNNKIQKYQGWLRWWKKMSIENIIKEKGQDYIKW